jgi:hypothetical protein
MPDFPARPETLELAKHIVGSMLGTFEPAGLFLPVL